MKFYIALMLDGEFPGGKDTTWFEVSEMAYDKIVGCRDESWRILRGTPND